MKRVFGKVEAGFDALYLAAALSIGVVLFWTAGTSDVRLLAGWMALVLVGGDAFHLIPRIRVAMGADGEALSAALGRGKQITSITMTVFYLLLWRMGLLLFRAGQDWTWAVVLLAAIRVILCFLPQNRWTDCHPPVKWGIWRNLPFSLLGLLCAILFFAHRAEIPGLRWMWLAVALSFGCYLPVVLWAHRNPKLGMLMMPKTCAYVWMLSMCLFL